MKRFVSKHSFSKSDIRLRTQRIQWGATCGRGPTVLELSMPVVWLASTREVATALQEAEWEDAQLEAQNQLTGWLSSKATAAYQSWNDRVARAKAAIVEPLTEPLLVLQGELRLPKALVDSIRWDILSAAMEDEYLPEGHSSFFFLELLHIYEAGRLPCGWRGQWPEGALLAH